MSELGLVPIEDLYEELLNRFDHAVFIGKKAIGKESSVSRRWKGDYHVAMGLCTDVSNEILSSLIDDEEQINPGDL